MHRLANILGLERTTLTRNLAAIERGPLPDSQCGWPHPQRQPLVDRCSAAQASSPALGSSTANAPQQAGCERLLVDIARQPRKASEGSLNSVADGSKSTNRTRRFSAMKLARIAHKFIEIYERCRPLRLFSYSKSSRCLQINSSSASGNMAVRVVSSTKRPGFRAIHSFKTLVSVFARCSS